MVVAGDTLVLGQDSRKMTRTREVFNYTDSLYYTQTMGTLVAHEDAGIVWIHVPVLAAFDTLYDFNAHPGDHWRLAELPSPLNCDPESWMQVVDTGTVNIDGDPLRWLAVDVHYLPTAPAIYRDTIIERIGSTDMYFLPHDRCNGFTDGQEGGVLRCYEDQAISYEIGSAPSCDHLPSVGPEETEPDPWIALRPNPANSEVMVEINGHLLRGWLRLIDACGRNPRELTMAGQQLELDLSGLQPGLYMLELIDGGQRLAAAKMTVE